MPRREPPGTVATNRRARHDYEILETFEAGLVLRGSEVKTLREGKGSLQDAYAVIEGDDIVLHMQIPAYSHTGYEGHQPTRPRSLILAASWSICLRWSRSLRARVGSWPS